MHHIKNLATLELFLAHQALGTDSDYQHLCRGLTYWIEVSSKRRLFDSIENFNHELAKYIKGLNIINFTADFLRQISKPFLNDWADKDLSDKVKMLFSVLDKSELPQKTISVIREDYLNPITDKIDKLCNEFVNLNCYIEELYDETKKFYEKVKPYFNKVTFADDSFYTEMYGDKIGEIILNKAIHLGNETNQWQRCKELCELAEVIITGQVLKNRLEENLKVISENIQQKIVWGDIKPIKRWIFNDTVFGIGTMLYGHSNYDPISESYETTRYFVFLLIPILPLARYRVINKGDYIKYLGKIPFRPFDKWHLGVAILAFLILIFFILFNNNIVNYIDKINDKPTTIQGNTDIKDSNASASFIKTNKEYSNLQEISSLDIKIENAKKILKTMENELIKLEIILKAYEGQIKSLDKEIEEEERKARAGLYINEPEYRSKINIYNNLIKKFNNAIIDYEIKNKKYKDFWNATNKDIKRYNFLIGIK